VLFGKHIDKLREDQAKRIHTLPVILGETASRWTVIGMLVAQLVLLVGLVATGYFHPVVLIALAAAPSLRRVFQVLRKPRPLEAPPDLFPGIWPLYFVATAFWYNRRFGAWFLLGLILDVGLSRMLA
jgi:1,4-dihydroxy-2-naphthoate polyprenyltransferase